MKVKIKFRFISAAFVMAMLVPFTLNVKADGVEPRSVVYTALGDSISTGYELKNFSSSYVSLFGKYLNTTPVDLGVNGLDSSGLLQKLDDDQKMIDQVKKSDIITISMGGNDMLTVFSNLKPSSLLDLVNSASKLQSASTQKQFSESVNRFQSNWKAIIARIKNLSPNAVIVANTLINPYRGIKINIPFISSFDFGAYSDKFVKQINSVITKDAAGNYLVADSYTLFQKYKGNAKLTRADLGKLIFDPHPTEKGHSLIYEAHKAVNIDFDYDSVKIDGPSTVTVESPTYKVCGKYSAQPLLSCFTAEKSVIAYSVANAGATGATIDQATGELMVKKPGEVRIEVTVALPQTNLSAQVYKTIRVENSKRWIYLFAYSLPTCVGVLSVLLFLFILLRRRKKQGGKGTK